MQNLMDEIPLIVSLGYTKQQFTSVISAVNDYLSVSGLTDYGFITDEAVQVLDWGSIV